MKGAKLKPLQQKSKANQSNDDAKRAAKSEPAKLTKFYVPARGEVEAASIGDVNQLGDKQREDGDGNS